MHSPRSFFFKLPRRTRRHESLNGSILLLHIIQPYGTCGFYNEKSENEINSQYNIRCGLEQLSRIIAPEGRQRDRFELLASNMRAALQNIEQHGLTSENRRTKENHLYQLHVLGFQQHPPVVFNDLCRTDRDYGHLAQS